MNNKSLKVFHLLISLILLSSLLIQTNCYLQFSLIRNKQKNQIQTKNQCIFIAQQPKQSLKQKLKLKQEQEYEQLCYFKDISYFIQLFYKNQNYHISIDLTSPFSWLKGQKCIVDQTQEVCKFVEDGKPVKKINKKHQKRNKVDSKDKKDQTQQQSPEQQSQKLGRISGSNQLVEGYLQQNKQIQFWTKDSGRLSRLMDILMLGFYLLQQKEKVTLHKTNFINATKLSSNMNILTDGVLSLRFDQGSENSFLSEIFQYTQTIEKIITIYVNDKQQSILTIGQLSIKNSAQGYSGIVWVPFNENSEETAYGRLPLVTQIMLESLVEDKQQDIQKDEDNSMFLVLSLSASYIGLPEKAMNQLVTQLKKKHNLQCYINSTNHQFLQCTILGKHQSSDHLSENLLIIMKQGSISLQLQTLILKRTKKKLILNLRIISKQQQQKQKSFIILGQPFFNKYFTILDYKQNRLGFSIKRTLQHNNFISTVSLIRFVSMLFFIGCSFLLCFHPLKRMFNVFQNKSSSYQFINRKTAEGRRLKYQPIQQNPYEQIAGTLRKVMDQNQEI